MLTPAGHLRISNLPHWKALRAAAEAYINAVERELPSCLHPRVSTQPDLLAAMAAHLGITEVDQSHLAEDFEEQFRVALIKNQIHNVLEVGPGEDPISLLLPEYPGLRIYAIDLRSARNVYAHHIEWGLLTTANIPDRLSRILYYQDDASDIGSVFKQIKFDMIYMRGVLSFSQTPVGMGVPERISFFNKKLLAMAQALSLNPKAAIFAAAIKSHLVIDPFKLPNIRTIFWEDTKTIDPLTLLNLQYYRGADFSPAWLGVFTREDLATALKAGNSE